jgi:nicotinamide-nucleotide amidase
MQYPADTGLITESMSIETLALNLVRQMREKSRVLATAESCTGGWVAQAVTAIPGSSNCFDRGFVTYSNLSKQQMLGVRAHTIEEHGAVSEAVVREMTDGVLQHSPADISVAISGIAGPGGGSEEKPVGTVWIAWQQRGEAPASSRYHFSGDREQVRQQAVDMALRGLLDIVNG